MKRYRDLDPDSLALLSRGKAPRPMAKQYPALDPWAFQRARTRGPAVYVTGYFEGSVDFGTGSMAASGLADGFLVRLADTTGVTSWATVLGGPGEDSGVGVVVDATGTVHLAGVCRDNVVMSRAAGEVPVVCSAGLTDWSGVVARYDAMTGAHRAGSAIVRAWPAPSDALLSVAIGMDDLSCVGGGLGDAAYVACVRP